MSGCVNAAPGGCLMVPLHLHNCIHVVYSPKKERDPKGSICAIYIYLTTRTVCMPTVGLECLGVHVCVHMYIQIAYARITYPCA